MTRYSISITASAQRSIARLEKPIQRRIQQAIDRLEETPRPFGAEKMQGEPNGYRLRVGDYRILYEIGDRELLVLVVKVGHRREVYR
ncbi:MAG TPA: type II toxin-antitoxin system RelE/ParE family toxin [bacterium]|nr:type II toxin-antitoxin system RelE/ParE family toxin [bacterium]